MGKGRFFLVMAWATVMSCLTAGAAFAGFGFGGDALGKSGLDFSKGYDVNTVMTVSGRVLAPPRTDEKEQVFVEVKSGGEIVNLSLGPKSFWEKRDIPLRPNDELTARGSRAQGKDGKIYLMVEKLTNRTTGDQTAVRSERGMPAWSGRDAGGMMRDGGGGSMMRGGGGGGGMMRH